LALVGVGRSADCPQQFLVPIASPWVHRRPGRARPGGLGL